MRLNFMDIKKEQNLKKKIASMFRDNGKVFIDGEISYTHLIDLARKLDEEIINKLLQDNETKNHFFKNISGNYNFLFDKFERFINSELLDNSYTSFKNKIGLTVDNKFIKDSNDIVLNFPFKDCYLEGGQTKDEGKEEYFYKDNGEIKSKLRERKEIFFNEYIAYDEIDSLLSKKAFCNFKRYTKNGTEEVKSFDRDENGIIKDNLIIKGNNLLALHSLYSEFKGKIKLIYIDPPYNTGNDTFSYNDNFNHSTWLVFMKDRLKIAKDLLREDGVIFVQCDDNEQAYLKVLMDEIFGRGNFVNTICWQKKNSPQNDAKWLSDNHDFILIYARDKENWLPNLLPRTEAMNARYKNPDNDPRGDWMSGDLSVKTYSANYDYPITTPSGRVIYPPTSRSWRTSKENFEKLKADNRIWFGKYGNNTPTIKRFLNEVKDGLTVLTLWLSSDVGTNLAGKNEIKALFTPSLRESEMKEAIHNESIDCYEFNKSNSICNEVSEKLHDLSPKNKPNTSLFATPKPEALLKRIIEISTNENDLIMDFFAGSGTTLAVAHKMKRQYIGIEQIESHFDILIERLKKVIEGEQGGISKTVNWKGGGEFIRCDIATYNANWIEKINKVKSDKEFKELFNEMKEKSVINHRLKIDYFETDNLLDKDFNGKDLEEKKSIMLEILDKNMFYVPFSERHDTNFKISDNDIKLSESFYER